MQSKIACAFLIVALVFLVAGIAELARSFEVLAAGREWGYPAVDRTADIIAVLQAWVVDPIYIALSAFMIEFLERIWNELKKKNSTP